MRILIMFLSLSTFTGLGCFSVQAQDKSNIHATVISAQGFAGGHLGLQKFEKNNTQWLGAIGFGGTAGAGFQLRFGRGLMLDAEGGFELNYYSYNNTNTSLLLGYNAPFGMLRASYMGSIRESKFKYWYASAGVAYMFTSGASLTDGEFDYTYTIQLAPGGIFTVRPEAGYLNFFDDHSFMTIGLTLRYAWKNTITNTMQKLPEMNFATGSSNGNYIGIIFRYYYPIKVFKKKVKPGNDSSTGREKI